VEGKATVKYLRSTARKARLVADEVRGKMVGDALSLLEFSITRSVAQDVSKIIKSAVANIQSKNADVAIDADELRIKEICVNEGPTMKRFRPRAQGRAYQILKRMCHISVTVSN
jgi:large subunit ribosomal protein L22